MSRLCPFIDGCPIFAYYSQNLMKDCMSNYCLGFFDACERRKLRLAGDPVPRDLMPDGTRMPESASGAPCGRTPIEADQNDEVRTVF